MRTRGHCASGLYVVFRTAFWEMYKSDQSCIFTEETEGTDHVLQASRDSCSMWVCVPFFQAARALSRVCKKESFYFSKWTDKY